MHRSASPRNGIACWDRYTKAGLRQGGSVRFAKRDGGSTKIDALGSLLLTVLVIQLTFFAIFVMVIRWVFRVNKMVALLESIDESLRQLPAVRSSDRSGQRISTI
jgi:hypothetical protein